MSKYHQKTALKFSNREYTYDQLDDAVAQAAEKIQTNNQLILVNDVTPEAFILHFLAVISSGNYPVVAEVLPLKMPTDQPFFIGQTSGSTGKPKFYVRDWPSWRQGFQVANQLFDFQADSVIATASPLTTSLGLHTLMLALYLGKTFQFINTQAELKQLTANTVLFSVPTFVLQAGGGSAYLKKIILGGGQLSQKGLSQLQNKFPKSQLIEFYGSSEASFISWQDLNKGKVASCVGQLFPDVNLQITPQQAIVVTSPYLFAGYLGQMVRPQHWQVDDLGYLDHQHLFLLGRQADLIDHGGNKVLPSEIEAAVQDLATDCVAFGVPDDIYGQKIALLLINPVDKIYLLATLKKRLPAFKRPQYYLTSDKIPCTRNQKISRIYLTALYLKGAFCEL
ncbi:AMP-binding protein [Convivina intestini]|uniref:AMP-binding protein n=1 Tax=Convivina intestini TaxID=1505726 RepID=UPI00200C20BE|nr:AMP-binding protein [Convivina intestini]